MTAIGLGGCFRDEKKILPNPEDPLPSYPQYRQPHNGGDGYDNLADSSSEQLYSKTDYF